MESALDGFDLVAEIYFDITSTDGFVSRTACHSLMKVSRYCFNRMSDAHGTTWPFRYNSVDRLDADEPADAQEEEDWLVLRGLRLICDFQTFLGAFRKGSPRKGVRYDVARGSGPLS